MIHDHKMWLLYFFLSCNNLVLLGHGGAGSTEKEWLLCPAWRRTSQV